MAGRRRAGSQLRREDDRRLLPALLCRPDEAALAIAEICRGIESAEEIPSLGELARMARLSVYHFHRLFKAVTGVTPRAYAIVHRGKRIRDALARPGTTVAAAIYDAGFNSSGRFYESSRC